LIANGLMGNEGIPSLDISNSVTQRPGSALNVVNSTSYRALGPDGSRGRVAVEVELLNEGTEPWTPQGSALTGPHGVALRAPVLWPRESLALGARRRFAVEADATREEARGLFTLEPRGGEGASSVHLGGVTFP
jgi:uncharacterized protein (TIGR02268 family)